MNKFKKSAVLKITAAFAAAAVSCFTFVSCGKDTTAPQEPSETTSIEESMKVTEHTSKAQSKNNSLTETSKAESSKPPESSKSSKPSKPSKPPEPSVPDPTVEPVVSLFASNVEKKSVTLSWQPVENVSGYEICRSDEGNNDKFEVIKLIKDGKIEKYTDYDVKSGQTYFYRIRTFVIQNKKYYYSEGVIANVTTALSDLAELRTASQSDGEITLEWDSVSGATGYAVFKMDENGEYQRLEMLKDEYTTAYTDSGLDPCKRYSYRVKPYKSVNGMRYYGGYAEVSAWTVTKAPEIKLSYNKNTGRITARWNKTDGAEGYDVLMSNFAEDNYKLIASTKETEFTTEKVKTDNLYFIKVRGYFTADGKKTEGIAGMNSIVCGKVPNVHGYNVGTTYIEISIDKQHMWYYKEGKLIVSTDVVTGYKYAHDTPTGLFYIINKASPAELVGDTWDIYVNYWLAVTYDGVGIHDSTWRSSYGGDIYTYDGSHGCINTPYDAVKKLYENCKEKTPVVIY